MKLGFKQVFVVYLKKNTIGPHVETVLWWAIYDWHENHTLCRELFFGGPSWIYDWHKYHNLGRNRKTMITNVLLGYNFISCVGEIQLKCETITYNDKYNVMNTG